MEQKKLFSGIERRRYRRVKANFVVVYTVLKPLESLISAPERENSVVMLDLSEGGMALLTNQNIPRLATLLLKFILIDFHAEKNKRIKTIKSLGEVRYTRFEKGGYRLGLSFTQIDEEDRSAIVNFVNLN